MSRFLAEKYKQLKPYTPGEQPKNRDLIKLNTNESPFPPSPKVISEVYNKDNANVLNLYPDPEAKELVKALSEYYGVPESCIFAGNGSDEILAFSFMAFQNKEKKFYFPNISYGFYSVYAEFSGADATQIPLDENFRIKTQNYFNLNGTIVIANPNAPTGISLLRSEIEEILKANQDNLVIVDEAYVDFGAESCIPLVKDHDNLLVVQTMSKSRNLAGARIGFAIASEEITCDLNRMKNSFNSYPLDRLSILAGAAAIKDETYFKTCIEQIKSIREEFTRQIKTLGFIALPSKANFVFVRHKEISGEAYFNRLREKNILVRHFDRELIKDYVRITIGKKEEMETLLSVTREMLSEGGKT